MKKTPEINEWGPFYGSSNQCVVVFTVLCFKGHCAGSLKSRHFFVALIASTFSYHFVRAANFPRLLVYCDPDNKDESVK